MSEVIMKGGTRRNWLAGVAAVLAGPRFVMAAEPRPKEEVYSGKVVPLSDLAARGGAKLDADAVAMALVTETGKVYTLLKDDATRLFFKDAKLLNRPMRLTGRLLPGSQVLVVSEVQSVLKGKPHEVYYWCSICAIRRTEKMICECCGGPMELREVAIK